MGASSSKPSGARPMRAGKRLKAPLRLNRVLSAGDKALRRRVRLGLPLLSGCAPRP